MFTREKIKWQKNYHGRRGNDLGNHVGLGCVMLSYMLRVMV